MPTFQKRGCLTLVPNGFPKMCSKVSWMFESGIIDLHVVRKNLFSGN